MASRIDIVEGGMGFSDEGCRYKWYWDWLELYREDTGDDRKSESAVNLSVCVKVWYGDRLWKLKTAGGTYCKFCRKEIN